MPTLMQSGLKTWTCNFKTPQSSNYLTKGCFPSADRSTSLPSKAIYKEETLQSAKITC